MFRQWSMLYTFFVILIGTFNLVLGFLAAARLGWGPSSWTETLSAVTLMIPRREVGETIPAFVDEIDVKRLIDTAEQRLRKIRHCKIEIEDPLQRSIYQLQKSLDGLLLTLECVELRLIVTRFTPPATSWDDLTQAVRGDVLTQLDGLDEAIEEVNQSLTTRDQHRFLTPRTQLSARVLSSRPEWQAWQADGEQPEATIELFQDFVQSSYAEFLALGNAALGLLRDLLGEAQPAMDWDPTLHRDIALGGQTVLAIDAERRLAAGEDHSAWIAQVRLDQAGFWNESLGLFLFHAAGERLADRLGGGLPGHWMVVPLQGGEILVRGEMPSVDEFTAEMDRMRQSIASTRLTVGETQVYLTASVVVVPDSPETPTQFRLDELANWMDEVEHYGGNRVFLCQDGMEVPVMPLEAEIPETSLELA
ncbi:MAG: hypothetical protein R3B96_03010 [Pirellulaceae bacterium]|nr:hypothetical protein [Planctomycetales bacterium]